MKTLFLSKFICNETDLFFLPNTKWYSLSNSFSKASTQSYTLRIRLTSFLLKQEKPCFRRAFPDVFFQLQKCITAWPECGKRQTRSKLVRYCPLAQHLISMLWLTLKLPVVIIILKIDNNFDNKFYRNYTEQYRIILFRRSLKASPVPDIPHQSSPR